MISMIRLLIIVTSVIALIGCSDEPKPPESTTAAPPADEHAQNISEDHGAYPLDYCVVSGEKLGSMGDTVEVSLEGRTVKLCCDMCESKLRKSPGKYLAILDSASDDSGMTGPAGDNQHDQNH